MRTSVTIRKDALSMCGLVLLTMIVIGCGRSGPRTYPVSGTVTWKGAPVPEGHLVLTPEDVTMTPHGEKIVDGEFQLRATAGKKRVEIFAVHDVGKPDPVMGGAVRRAQYIPDWYNDQSVLTVEITPDGDNYFEFPLTDEKPNAGD